MTCLQLCATKYISRFAWRHLPSNVKLSKIHWGMDNKINHVTRFIPLSIEPAPANPCAKFQVSQGLHRYCIIERPEEFIRGRDTFKGKTHVHVWYGIICS